MRDLSPTGIGGIGRPPWGSYNYVTTMDDPSIELKLRRVGNSLGVILPKEILALLGVEGREGEILALERLPDGSGIALRPADDRFAEKLALLRDTMKQYRNALRELSK